MPEIATTDDVETALHRPLTEPERLDAEALIADLVGLLELRLNRELTVKTFTDEWHRVPRHGQVTLLHGPLVEVTSVSVDGGAPITDATTLADWDIATWPAGSRLLVTYRAGDETPRPGVKRLIVDVVARTIAAGLTAGLGVIRSYSVEGTSITYGEGVGGGGQTGRITVGDLGQLKRLRRPVMA